MEAEDYINLSILPSDGTLTTSGSTTPTTVGSIGYYPVDWPKPSKNDQLRKMLWEVDSEKRLKLILTKLKEDKLTVDEVLQIIQGDRAIDING